jgi:UDP-N-acetylglucosamine 2-epimerase (non-hydrolysing)
MTPIRSSAMSDSLSSFSVLVAAGTRPEVVKLAPVLAELERRDLSTQLVLTGQHHSESMMGSHLTQFSLRPTEQWELIGSEGQRVGQLLANAMDLLTWHRPSVVVVQGDTYTVPLMAMAARRHGIPVAHVEAGLRSGNGRSQEEMNRRMTAAIASVHYAPTETALDNLLGEGVPASDIAVVGNSICDVLRTSGVKRVPVAQRAGIVVTAHRATNVDDPERLARLIHIVTALTDCDRVTFPMHPRTRDRLEQAGLLDLLEASGAEIIEPVAHAEMIERIAQARLVVTDSGGLQEETSWFGVPVVVLRASTPRPEGVNAGQASLAGLDLDQVMTLADRFLSSEEQRRVAALTCPYGDGFTAGRIVDDLLDRHRRGVLVTTEPSMSGASTNGQGTGATKIGVLS